jgi:hypothetical protein
VTETLQTIVAVNRTWRRDMTDGEGGKIRMTAEERRQKSIADINAVAAQLAREREEARTLPSMYEERTLNRLQTLCDDGTRAVSTWSPTLQQWQTTISPPPGKTCTGRMNSRTHQVEVHCR